MYFFHYYAEDENDNDDYLELCTLQVKRSIISFYQWVLVGWVDHAMYMQLHIRFNFFDTNRGEDGISRRVLMVIVIKWVT